MACRSTSTQINKPDPALLVAWRQELRNRTLATPTRAPPVRYEPFAAGALDFWANGPSSVGGMGRPPLAKRGSGPRDCPHYCVEVEVGDGKNGEHLLLLAEFANSLSCHIT